MLSTSAAGASKPPVLSYAERAKKAQSIKSPAQPRIVASSTPASASTSSQSPVARSSSSPSGETPAKPDAGPSSLNASTTASSVPINGDASASPPKQTGAAALPAKTPVPNFWNVRKEQMAASRPIPASNLVKSYSSPSPASIPVDVPSQDDSSRAQSKEDPRIPPPPVIDVAAWPEVGKIQLPEVQNISKEGKEDGTVKKGDKPKWVPIPAEELQATADAMLKNSKGKNSRGASRNTRNTSGRNSTTQSASHSRVQSRSGSVQSSPRFPRGRKLPGDEASGSAPKPNGVHTPGSTRRPSRTNSPQIPNSTSTRSSGQRAPPPPPPPSGDPLPPSVFPFPHSPPFMMFPHGMPALTPPYPSTSPGPTSPPLMGIPHGRPPYPLYPVYGGYDYPPMHWNGLPQYPDPTAQPFVPQQAAPSPPLNAPKVVVQSVETVVSSTKLDKPVVFGSIETAVVDPAVQPIPVSRADSVETAFSKLAIGVSGEDALGRLTTRTRSSKGRNRSGHDDASQPVTLAADGRIEREASMGSDISSTSKWEFGTTSSLGAVPSDSIPNGARLSPMSGSISPAQLPIDPTPILVTADQHPHARGQVRPAADHDPDFLVKDFGYGFGQAVAVPISAAASVPVPAVSPGQQEPTSFARQRAIEEEKLAKVARQIKEEQDRPAGEDLLHPPPSAGGPKGRRSFESGQRGGVSSVGHGGGRRGGGRGGSGSSGRGQGRGGRGGSNNYQPGQSQPPPRQQQQHQQQGPMISLTPPPFPPPPLMHLGEAAAGFYGLPPRPLMAPPYLPPGVAPPGPPGFNDTFVVGLPQPPPPPPPSHLAASTGPPGQNHPSPPVPVPMTTLSFPLDSTRYYLLGQLEYYLSPQNMAQDFFLRQRMDSRGWIPIPLIASFNRVRKLTPDANLVREVLYLSSMVQVRDNYVRMGGWERFVLPDAPASIVDDGENPYPPPEALFPERMVQYPMQYPHQPQPHHAEQQKGGHVQGQQVYESTEDEEDEDEDDVVFVMGKDA